jgi:hypothetical protein
MHQIWVAAGLAIAVIAVGVPFAAIILVSIASRREEAAHSLSRHAPGAAARAARRLLGFRSEHISPLPGWAARNVGRWRKRSSLRPASTPPLPRLVRESRPVGLALGAAARPVPAGKQLSEVRFGHARRSLPDSSQLPAGGQPQPGSVRTDQRQGAGV